MYYLVIDLPNKPRGRGPELPAALLQSVIVLVRPAVSRGESGGTYRRGVPSIFEIAGSRLVVEFDRKAVRDQRITMVSNSATRRQTVVYGTGPGNAARRIQSKACEQRRPRCHIHRCEIRISH
jgi:hypothetical protein